MLVTHCYWLSGSHSNKKVAEKKQELYSVQSVGITKTRDVDVPETYCSGERHRDGDGESHRHSGDREAS